jgi:hypothetical protein
MSYVPYARPYVHMVNRLKSQCGNPTVWVSETNQTDQSLSLFHNLQPSACSLSSLQLNLSPNSYPFQKTIEA